MEAGSITSGIAAIEPRIAKIETHIEYIRADLDLLKPLPVKIAIVEERVAHLPTKGWMTGALLTALAIIAGLIAFGEKLHAFLK